MKPITTPILLTLGFTLAGPATAEQPATGYQPSFLDWDLSAVRIGTPAANNADQPAGLSRRLAELQAGDPALEDISILEEEPITPDPEALADLEYIASAHHNPVK